MFKIFKKQWQCSPFNNIGFKTKTLQYKVNLSRRGMEANVDILTSDLRCWKRENNNILFL